MLVGYFLKLFASVAGHSFDLPTYVRHSFTPFTLIENLLECLEFVTGLLRP